MLRASCARIFEPKRVNHVDESCDPLLLVPTSSISLKHSNKEKLLSTPLHLHTPVGSSSEKTGQLEG